MVMEMFAWLPLLLLCCSVSQNGVANAFVPAFLKSSSWQQPMFLASRRRTHLLPLCDSNKNNIDNDDDSTPKLGIDIGKQLAPLSEEDVAELRAEAYELISDGVAEGIDEIERLRAKFNKEIEKQRRASNLKSELLAKKESERLLTKIDAMTDEFLKSTSSVRESTKRAAAADASMTDKGGVDWGSWGDLGGGAVLMSSSAGGASGSLLGSVEAVKKQSSQATTMAAEEASDAAPATADAPSQYRVLMVANEKEDPVAKQLVPKLVQKLEDTMQVAVDVVAPTATMPLGADRAACLVFFLTSLSDSSSLKKPMLDRLLRRTLDSESGAVIQPPTQLVAISTVGTERTNKMPYSMQNMFGGKLDKRRQMEEVLINTVRQRVQEPPMDYTICKLGELQEKSKKAAAGSLELVPGDVLDGNVDPETAAQVVFQAMAFQPTARNATFGVTGSLDEDVLLSPVEWDEVFCCLDGPEVWRLDDIGNPDLYIQLSEYLKEWAMLLASSGKGLTTPIRVEQSKIQPISRNSLSIQEQTGIQLLFQPTATGKNYMSREEEKAREKETGAKSAMPRRRNVKEGGLEVVVELTHAKVLRVRAKRCNYAEDAVIKELSEETILKRLEESCEKWKKDNPYMP